MSVIDRITDEKVTEAAEIVRRLLADGNPLTDPERARLKAFCGRVLDEGKP